MDLTPLDPIGSRQLGLVTTAQMDRAGIGPDQRREMVRRGVILPVWPTVYRMAGVPRSREQAWLAAALAAGDGTLLSHATATSAWRLRVPESEPQADGIDLLVSGRHRPRLAGVRAHHTDLLPAPDRSHVGPLPVVSVARTLIDICGTLPFGLLEAAVDDALRRRILSVPSLVRAAAGVPPSGRRAIRPMREILRERAPGYDPAGSDRELDIVALIVEHGYPPPVKGHRVTIGGRKYELDVSWPEVTTAIEYDSVLFHADVTSFHANRARWRALTAAGWDVYPVTSRTARSEILAIAASVADALATPHPSASARSRVA